MLTAVSYLSKSDPELLVWRIKLREKEQEQETIVILGTAIFLA